MYLALASPFLIHGRLQQPQGKSIRQLVKSFWLIWFLVHIQTHKENQTNIPKIRRKYAKYSNKALMFGYTKGLVLHIPNEERQHAVYVGSLFIDKEEASFFTSS